MKLNIILAALFSLFFGISCLGMERQLTHPRNGTPARTVETGLSGSRTPWPALAMVSYPAPAVSVPIQEMQVPQPTPGLALLYNAALAEQTEVTPSAAPVQIVSPAPDPAQYIGMLAYLAQLPRPESSLRHSHHAGILNYLGHLPLAEAASQQAPLINIVNYLAAQPKPNKS